MIDHAQPMIRCPAQARACSAQIDEPLALDHQAITIARRFAVEAPLARILAGLAFGECRQ